MTALLLLLCLNLHAGELAGVKVADSASVGGQTVVLNGLGLREKYFLDIYVGALYLPTKTTSADAAISQDVPKRISMSFIYSHVTKDQIAETFREGVAKQSITGAVAVRIEELCGMVEDVYAGDVVEFDYVPGTGTTVRVRGVTKGTIPGGDFMKSLWAIYLGPYPPTAALRAGMMGT